MDAYLQYQPPEGPSAEARCSISQEISMATHSRLIPTRTVTLPPNEDDYGKDNYALVSWSDVPDGRRVAIGWMSNWQYAAEVPTMQFRSANTLPREIRLFEGLDGETYASCGVAQEMLGLRGEDIHRSQKTVGIGQKKSFALPESNSGTCEITLDMNKGKSSKILLTLSNKEECVSMWYDTAANTFSVDGRKSGITDFSQDFASVTTAPCSTRNLR